MKRKVTKEQAYLSELALASFQHEEKGIVIFLIFHLNNSDLLPRKQIPELHCEKC